MSAPLRAPQPHSPPQGLLLTLCPTQRPPNIPGCSLGWFQHSSAQPHSKESEFPFQAQSSWGVLLATALSSHSCTNTSQGDSTFPKGLQHREGYEVSPIYLAASQLCLLQPLFPANILHCGMPAIFYKVNNFFLIG